MNLSEPLVQSFRNLAGKAIPTIVEKRWGKENIYINGDGYDSAGITNYCMKAIYIDPNSETSMHFHIRKHETLLVVSGKLLLEYLDGKGAGGVVELLPGDAFIVPPGFQHRLCALEEEVLLIEASTPDDPQDSIRVSL